LTHIAQFLDVLARDQDGVTTVEYAILVALVVALSIGTWRSWSEAPQRLVEAAGDTFEQASSTPCR